MAVIVLEVDPDGLPRYASMNAKARAFAKLTREDYFGKTALEIYGGVTGKRALAHHLAVIKAAKPTTYDIVLPSIHETRHLRTTLTPVFDAAGQITHLVGSSADVTSERERDLALELTKHAKEKAEEASLAKERFLANMSHEIRTPMNGILGMCEMLQETVLDDQQALFTSTIFNSANALLGIINDVLDFSKIQAEKISLSNEVFSLREVVQETVTLLSAKAAFKGLELNVVYDAGTPENFVGDASKLRQILLNLLGNAIKFTDQGRIVVGVGYEKSETSRPLSLWVEDTGYGIDQKQQGAIFSAFQQVNPTPSSVAEGTGLGLAISQALVERMGGSIEVTSALEKGATFTVHLDLDLHDEPAPSPVARLKPAPLKLRATKSPKGKEKLLRAEINPLDGLKVLVAEDNKTNQLVVKKMLARTGADIFFAANGQLAVEAFQKTDFDLVLMDLSMPVLGGLEATRQIRQYEQEVKGAACRIIALTANAQPSDAEACYEVGMNDFISKPFRKQDLISRLQARA
ncbi:response regulator [Pseudophaeobacter sp.]|uniref:response regulator n=1 Tax=Pseudophaeobacter sp. TaxID=1971739 RepID=UPI003299DA85